MAKAFLKPGDVIHKGEAISKAMTIIDGRCTCRHHKTGGEIAHNLDGLHDGMKRCLLQANAVGDHLILDKVTHLSSEIKSAWDAIPAYAVSIQARLQPVAVVGQVPVVD